VTEPAASAGDIGGRVTSVRERIAAAARRSGREPDAVRLVAVTKGVTAERASIAAAAGVSDLGENRAQELLAKRGAVEDALEAGAAVHWHFIGRLQRNKVPKLAPVVAWWHSIDREVLGAALEHHAPGARVLVQVDLADEAQKGGCAPTAAGALVESLVARGLEVVGLTTIPPREGDPRPRFATLRELAADLRLPELSMGMSDDFEAAVEEGATIVRVGRAIFGPRQIGDRGLG